MAGQNKSQPIVVIMAGGSGTRFWPLSSPAYPKQFLKLMGTQSILAETVERICLLADKKNIFICAVESQKPLLEKELPQVPQLILEPEARNTAPCLMLSAYSLLKQGISSDTVMVVLAADHFIAKAADFRRLVEAAVGFAREHDSLITLGIVPSSPHTGYGYIEAESGDGPALKVKRFVEKPNLDTAKQFVAAKSFYWNSGMFVWRLDTIVKAFEKYCAQDWKALNAQGPAAYSQLTAQPIDIAVMEKADNLRLFPADIGWSDIGSWNALHELRREAPVSNVVLSGNARAIESEGCLVHVPVDRSVALVGVKDLVVVEKDGQLLIANREKDQLVREAAKAFETGPRPG